MNDQAKAALLALGVSTERIHSERFAVDAVAPIAQPHVVTASGSEATTRVSVVMDGRRRSFTMARDGETVLEAAEQAGLDLPFSCRAGVCSTCRTKVAQGAVEMAANYALEPWELEAGYVLACQSRPTTPELELDYDQK
jgi:ring-1,2-phenylacetyl-CoA epoxidase subunit PaaE